MDFQKELKNAESELLKLEQQRIEIERKMQGWIKLIEGYRTLNQKFNLGEPPTREEFQIELETPSLPSKILAALFTCGPIAATQIRDWLVAKGAVDASSKNLLINIHTTLKRLIDQDQVEEMILPDESKAYKYVTPIERAIRESIPGSDVPRLPSACYRPTPTLDTSKKTGQPAYDSGMRGNEEPRKPRFRKI